MSEDVSQEVKEALALVRIREAVGDPEGKLMQDELTRRVRNLAKAENQLREGVIAFIKEYGDSVFIMDRLKFLLDDTQWWDWDETENGGNEG